MSIELNARFISEFNEAFPRKNDLLKEGDDHLRLIKGILKNTMPGFDKQISISADKLNKLDTLLDPTDNTLVVNGNFQLKEGVSVDCGKAVMKNASDPVDDQDLATKAYVEKQGVSAAWPVGSVYISVIEGDPKDTLGVGEWEKFASGRVLIGTGSDKDESGTAKLIALGGKGGNYSETLTTENLPAHSHTGDSLAVAITGGGEHKHAIRTQNDRMSIHDINGRWFRGAGTSTDYTETDGSHSHTGTVSGETGSVGGGTAHNNMMPWIGCHIWKRIK
ncbi:MAG: phage baseplate protein [Cetobacterium sp.]|uniref:phage baseplate protein n=1 Tax=Cetobacterium sp. TaxID=2071632 RepID=UPI003EE76F78